MDYCEYCDEVVCLCVKEFQLEEQEETAKFRFEYAFESLTEKGQTQFHTILPNYE